MFAKGGDGLAAAFARAGDAVQAAVDAQAALFDERWPVGVSMSVRMGLHSGEADERENGFFGAAVNRAARIMSVAQGGQILISAVTASLATRSTGGGAAPGRLAPSAGGERARRPGCGPRRRCHLNPTPPPTDVVEGNLPRPVTEYVGDLAELRRRVGGLSGRRLVTLTGSGGVGKTRTAIEIGWLSSDQFPGGVWLVELAPVGVGDAVPAAVGGDVGGASPAGVDDDRVDRGLVAVPSDVADPRQLRTRLGPRRATRGRHRSGAPDATVLATSREPLGLPGEVVRRVPSLDPATDAVQLFAERAATARTGSRSTTPTGRWSSAICARLDGIPLAIELAAARVRALTPAEILARLDDRFRLLRSSGRGGHERHQTLLATVTWSVQLLSAEERCLFERLSVFAGTFSLGDTEAVCGIDPLDESDVVDLLSALVDRSMVVAEAGPDGATRYRLLETLRQYGEQALAADASTATMRDRHVAHFVVRAEHWCAQQLTADEPAANRAFAVNWDNLRAAFDWALATGRRREVADLLYTTYWFAVHTGRWEHRDWAVAARAAGADTGQDRQRHHRAVGRSRRVRRPDRSARRPRSHRAGPPRPRHRKDVAGPLRHRVDDQRSRRDRTSGGVAARKEPRCTNPITEAWTPRHHPHGTCPHPTQRSSRASFGWARPAPAPACRR